MGKKNQNNAEQLLDELKGEEQSAQDTKQRNNTKPTKTGATSTKATSTETATEVKKKPQKSYEGVDPDLQAVLSMPGDDEATPPPIEETALPTSTKKETSKGSQEGSAKKSSAKKAPPQPPAAPQPSAQGAQNKPNIRAVQDSGEPEKTDRMDQTQKIQVPKASQESSLKLAKDPQSSGGAASLEEQLKSANYLELAQNRVLELEKEVQKLRRDNEQLAAAGQHFKGLTDSIKQQLRQAESNYTNLKEIAEEEKKILTQSLEAKEIKINVLQDRLVELEEKINSSFDHVRIRERELENRIEIMKTESDAVTTTKDEMILDLKKQLSLVNSDLEKYRIQNQKTVAKLESKEELLRRTVKALRIALTMLEGSHSDDD